ncbi:enoyl-CoA hydratase-related protein [Mycobacterium sp.]|jgi:2-(1,2-epoxy-1,2-dihydrophenyl)acetyl-CoA isomerase|uniref:enoyl-CoA hydratase/isomerase family protein n=1 Tax=Mycobacterium sp. TaxID=1785 RepID=UPI002613084D|nr:enoyl-CoA hydratase-related protein [Mycobacterium sp.]
MSSNIIVRRSGGVVHVVLNRPARKNAMLPEMWAELTDIVIGVDGRASDRVLVLTGEGGAFCTGADIAARLPAPREAAAVPSSERVLDDIKQCVLALVQISKPTVAAVDGIAAGGGCNLALACDLVIASDQAQFSEIFVRRGLTVDTGGSWILPRLIGSARARRLVLLGEVIDAELAYQMGLVTHLIPRTDFHTEVAAIASQLCESPAVTLAADKRLLAASPTLTLVEALDRETASQLDMLGRPHVEAARRAFLASQGTDAGTSVSAVCGRTSEGQQVS